MTKHGRAHSVARPYVCPQGGCAKRSSDLESLNVHVQTHWEVGLTLGPKPLLSELKRVIDEDDSRNMDIKSFASLFGDHEISTFQLKTKYRYKDTWQLIIVPEDFERGKQIQSKQRIISTNGNHDESQAHQIGFSIAALLSRWQFPLPSMDRRATKYMLQTAERMVCKRAPIYLNGVHKEKTGCYSHAETAVIE